MLYFVIFSFFLLQWTARPCNICFLLDFFLKKSICEQYCLHGAFFSDSGLQKDLIVVHNTQLNCYTMRTIEIKANLQGLHFSQPYLFRYYFTQLLVKHSSLKFIAIVISLEGFDNAWSCNIFFLLTLTTFNFHVVYIITFFYKSIYYHLMLLNCL